MRLVVRLLVLILIVLAPTTAFAHGVGIQATLRDDCVRIEGFFDDDTPTQAAKVTITTLDARTIAEGVTDDTGVWSFPRPPAGRYLVVLDAGGGHVAKTQFTVPQLSTNGTISDGLDRATQTGARRWIVATLGVVLIGVLTLVAQRIARKGQSS